jgi:hypothetical protein
MYPTSGHLRFTPQEVEAVRKVSAAEELSEVAASESGSAKARWRTVPRVRLDRQARGSSHRSGLSRRRQVRPRELGDVVPRLPCTGRGRSSIKTRTPSHPGLARGETHFRERNKNNQGVLSALTTTSSRWWADPVRVLNRWSLFRASAGSSPLSQCLQSAGPASRTLFA